MSKLDQLKALGDAKRAARNSSDGGVESRHATRCDQPSVVGQEDSVAGTDSPEAGVAPGPSEAKSKRGRPRLGESRDKPWIEAGMSERTWYRRQAEAKAKAEKGE